MTYLVLLASLLSTDSPSILEWYVRHHFHRLLPDEQLVYRVTAVLLCRFILHLRQDYSRRTDEGRDEHSLHLSDMSHARFAVPEIVRDTNNLEPINATGDLHQGMELWMFLAATFQLSAIYFSANFQRYKLWNVSTITPASFGFSLYCPIIGSLEVLSRPLSM